MGNSTDEAFIIIRNNNLRENENEKYGFAITAFSVIVPAVFILVIVILLIFFITRILRPQRRRTVIWKL
ncbi:hypothetical protein DPMN_157515 [Dreissena polymorpha]|uniref:Uncharacterized protein n=1 Tax=Dreissena polymorpha TaxID=45954 RepID=A0A9D4EFK0_DREPO|nr:hypothetical protein DPMN_157515 [Dreissena polymorpha]